MIRAMAAEVRKEWSGLAVTRRMLLHFGLAVAAMSWILAGFLLWREDPRWPLAAAAGLSVLIISAIFPRALYQPFRFWLLAGITLGWVMSRAMLTVIYGFIVTPIGLLLRLTGKDLLDRGIDRTSSSYWGRHESAGKGDRYRKQF